MGAPYDDKSPVNYTEIFGGIHSTVVLALFQKVNNSVKF